MTDYRLLINGALVEGDTLMHVINPATAEPLATCPRASRAQVDCAIHAAKVAQPAWADLGPRKRGKCLALLADSLDGRAEEFARLLTQEQGKPLAEARDEIAFSSAFIRHFAGLDVAPRIVEDSEHRRVEVHYRPLGVVAAIIPWNFPLLLIAFKLPPALLAGNTIVIKPSPTTPLTTLRLGELCADVFPAGVVNIVTDDNDLGGHITGHTDVAKISFTGSSETGRKVMASAASTLKRVTLELGGNDAAIVLASADPKEIAPKIFASAFMNAGQVCLAVKRVYAHDSVYDALCEELAELARSAVVDDGLSQGAQIGPLQNKRHYDKVISLLASAAESGTVIAGGQPIDRPGYFVQPTIVRDISDGTRLVDEEQFGPILPVIRFHDAEDALAKANSSTMGLGGSVWSSDAEEAEALAGRLEAGMVWVNKHLDFGPNIPFGGAKQSGIGMELGDEGLAEFSQLQVVNVAK